MNAKKSALTAIVLIGIFSGGYFVGRSRTPEVRVIVRPTPEVIKELIKRGNDPILAGVIDDPDLNPMTRKDMVLQMWYGNQAAATSVLEADTGHVFTPIGLGVSPFAILTEQQEFMKGWLANYEKMAKEDILKRKATNGNADDTPNK